MASWLNLFVRHSDVVEIACIAQSVNVISPLITGPTGLFRQTIYFPLYLFSKYMRDGVSIGLSTSSPSFDGETLPEWIGQIKGKPRQLDSSAVLYTHPESGKRSVRVAVVNRDENNAYTIPVRVAFAMLASEVEVHEVWHEDVKVRNGWDGEKVKIRTWKEKWDNKWTFKEHSFTLLVLDIA